MIPDLCTAGDAHATAACIAMCAAKVGLLVGAGFAAARAARRGYGNSADDSLARTSRRRARLFTTLGTWFSPSR